MALGRKSWLFAGSDRGAERAAVMATLIQTAKLNDVDPQALARRRAGPLGRPSDPPARRPAAVELVHAIDHRHRGLTVQLNKVHSVRTLALVARDLDEDVDWLADIAIGMEPEDGLIWVYDQQHEDGTMAFSAFGLESLRDLIKIHRGTTK